MGTAQPYGDADAESGIEFDQLCHVCASLFDDKVIWEYKRYRPHHDIFSLASSAAHGCHLCSLMLGQIEPENVRQLQQDLGKLLIRPSQQIGINLFGEGPFNMDIAARGSTLPHPRPTDTFDKREGWSVIGGLRIRDQEDVDNSPRRSKAIWSCSDTTIAQVAKWMGQCVTSHKECFEVQTVAATRDVLPKRLIDISAAATSGRFRLVPTASMPQDTVYVTLSHCWGGSCGKILRVDNVETLEDGVEVSILPKTFQDAVMITTKLGVQYLWIDALCIIQDSPDATEWRHEASIMGDIYANSYVTLAATTSKNSEGGLLHRRSPLSVWPCKVMATWRCLKPGRLVVSVGRWTCEMYMKPLEDRAWAFQEWLLSKSLIHFSHDQVRWECYCLSASQTYPEGVDKDIDYYNHFGTKRLIKLILGGDSGFDTAWLMIREKYSQKQLTKVTDKLAAFSGIARMVHKVLKSAPEEYCIGLWKPRLLNELLWERRGRENSGRSSGEYVAPTWSWASLNGPFWNTLHKISEEGSWLVDVIETRIQHIEEDIFGPVSGGCLVLRCGLYPVTLTVVEKDPKLFSTKFHWEMTEINGASVKYHSTANLDYNSPADSTSPSKVECYFMPMCEEDEPYFQLRGMLLKPIGSSPGQYYRIGVLTVYGPRDPDVMASMVPGRVHGHDNLYTEMQEGGRGLIEII